MSSLVLILPSSSALVTFTTSGISAILINRPWLAGLGFKFKMPRRQGKQVYPKYTRIFSNVANPFREVEFQTDSRDPYEELRALETHPTLKHRIDDFGFGLQDIIEVRYDLKQFCIRYKGFREDVDDHDIGERT